MAEQEQQPSPVEKFLHDAQALPGFDLGDELQSFKAQYGEEAATEAESRYWEEKEAS